MTTRKTARKAGKATAIAIASSCSGCRDNFHLPELHDPATLAALDVLDGPAIRGQIERRRACTACPDGEKPCMKPAPAPIVQAQAATETVAPAVPTTTAEPDLPSVRQVERLLLDFMISSIERLTAIRCDDADWKDADVDIDMAADLALAHLKRLRADPDSLDGDFELNWWTAASAINLGHKAFSRPDSQYGKTVAGLVSDFEALADLPAFVESRNEG